MSGAEPLLTSCACSPLDPPNIVIIRLTQRATRCSSPPTPHPPSPLLIYPLPQAPSSVDKRIKPLKVASSASQPGEEVPPSRSSQPEPAREARPPTSPLPRSPHTDAYPCGRHSRHRNVPKRAPHRSQHRHYHLGRHVASPPLPAPPYSNPDSVGSVFRHPTPSTSRPAPGLKISAWSRR